MTHSQSLIPRAVHCHPALVFLCLLLLVLAGHAALFEVGSSAAKLRQTPTMASSSTSLLKLFESANTQGSDDVRIVLTTFENGEVSSRVIGHTRKLNVTTTGATSGEAASPTQTAAAGDIVISQIYSSGGNPGST